MSGQVMQGFGWTEHDDHWPTELESAVILGVAPRVALGASVGFSNEAGWVAEAVSPSVLISLTPRWDLPVRFAVDAAYTFSWQQSEAAMPATMDSTVVAPPPRNSRSQKRRSQAATDTAITSSVPLTEPSVTASACTPDMGPDCEEVEAPHDHTVHDHGTTGSGSSMSTTSSHAHAPSASASASASEGKKAKASGHSGHAHSSAEGADGQSHGGVHQHGVEGLRVRFIAEAELTPALTVYTNLVNFTPRDAAALDAWGYGVGARYALHHDFGLSAEIVGDLTAEGTGGSHQAFLSAGYSPVHQVMVKLGVGLGLTHESPGPFIGGGLVWRF
jgi:hypothetical protein